MKKNICFIPARSGSERVKNKHLIKINNRTILEITIKQAQRSGIFNEIHFSSDGEKLIEIAKNMGVATFRRSTELSGNKVGLITVIQEHIKQLNLAYNDSLCLFLTTNVLRTVEDLLKGYEVFEEYGCSLPVISVGTYQNPMELSFKLVDGYLENYLDINWEELNSTRKQDFKPCYFWNDAFIIDSIYNWSRLGRKLYMKKMIPYLMPPERSIGIDYPFQLLLTKALFKGNKSE